MTELVQSVAALLGLALVLALIPWIIRPWTQRAGTQPAPELHHGQANPVPRLGGVAIVVPFLLVLGVLLAIDRLDHSQLESGWTILLGALAMFGLGLADDLRPLGAKKKLAGQILIAIGIWGGQVRIETIRVPYLDIPIELGVWGLLITVLWIVSFTNLINLVDGMDGLAASICLMIMVLLLFSVGNSPEITILAATLCGALLGFLRYNWPPARIYLGDGGAYFLGSLIGILTIVSSQKGTVLGALIAPLFVLAFPILDTVLAIVRRSLLGLPLFRADRQHLHHRLQRMGLSRREVLLILQGVTLIFLVMAFAVYATEGRLAPILAGVAFLALLLGARNLEFSREWLRPRRVVAGSLDRRHEVQYALALTRWLELEAERARTLSDLWLDYTFLMRKLGFAEARLRLNGEERRWRARNQPSAKNATPHVLRHELEGGRAGTIELRAWPQIMDDPHFALISELAVEAWLKAARRFVVSSRLPLGFDPAPDQAESRSTRTRFYVPSMSESGAFDGSGGPAQRP